MPDRTDSPVPPSRRKPVLDGVRACSIVLVLMAHLLPLNDLLAGSNYAVGEFGMALFFVLSGYLIGGQLLRRVSPRVFVAHRLARVLPLAWTVALIVGLVWAIDPPRLIAHLLFYANLPPKQLTHPLDHYWSLCVELQFYAIAALLLCLQPRWTWFVVPALLLADTTYRVSQGAMGGSVTWVRGDDILAGAVLILLLKGPARERVCRFLAARLWPWLMPPLLYVACVLPEGGNHLNYFRSYFAAIWVGSLLCQPSSRLSCWLSHARWAWLAAVSYAVYILHVPLAATWLGSGDLLEKYAKRPLLLVVVFALAHLSTFYFERRFTRWARAYGERQARRIQPLH
ncbi:MAG: acyltransferase [Burkholderiales bacterium PBB1]|nr:MAG: acyltransferase [Burkholderiales bacterium PBB1]